MDDQNQAILLLQNKIDDLLKRQDEFSREINSLREALYRLKANQPIEKLQEIPESIIPPIPVMNTTLPVQDFPVRASVPRSPKGKSDLEKTIGENLISKIGIAITIIGVAIGAKYSIDNELINPLTRILLGYIVGILLYGIGLRLKAKYENYSAVLVSGAITIAYFMTYLAYSFYGILPQMVAFAMMVGFTVLTVFTAIQYNKQIIAHIGLVGAYAIPFLLSQGEGRSAILFSYIAIINLGILFIAFKKYWKPVYYSSFILTWLIFSLWYLVKYDLTKPFNVAFIFLCLFFLIFYSIFLAYKLIRDEKFGTEDVILLLSNSFIFYGLGYSLLSKTPWTESLAGLFTLGNALIHSIVAAVIYRRAHADRNLFYLVAGLVLIFITISIPVQLDGNWVTLLWAGEAALLFWIGKSRNVQAYQRLSYPLMILAFISIFHDWMNVDTASIFYKGTLTPFLNVHFLTAVLFIAAFLFMYYIHKKNYSSSLEEQKESSDPTITLLILGILLVVIYFSIRMEIKWYWDQLYEKSSSEINVEGQEYPETIWNQNLIHFKNIWMINYTLVFLSLLAFINHKKIKSAGLALVNLCLAILVLGIFLTLGLSMLEQLRDHYLVQSVASPFPGNSFYISIRYITFGFVGLMLFSMHRYMLPRFTGISYSNMEMTFDIALYTTLIWMASSELIIWMDNLDSTQPDKLGLSILWGVAALAIIALGIWKQKKYLRVGAIALFTVTLIKLFFYDIAHLNTIAKTIVFVSLGILLLVISFLYNKYKDDIFEDNEVKAE